MRTTRSVIISVLAVCLLGLPSGALGQSSDEPASAAEATAPVWFENTTSGISTFGGIAPGYQGVRGTVDAEDDRASGRMVMVMTMEEAYARTGDPVRLAQTGRYTGIVRIENDEGAWQGPAYGVIYPDGTEANYGWFSGEGAYEGLTFFSGYYGSAYAEPRHEQGMIWEGPPPAVPDAALLPD